MRIALGRFACHLDSDTLLTSNAMAAVVRFMDEHPGVAACVPKLLNGDGSRQHCIRGFAGAGTFILQALNWQRLFPHSRLMNPYPTNKRVREKMLACSNACQADAHRQSVGAELRPNIGILARDHRREGKRHGRMVRRKRTPAIEEVVLIIRLIWPKPSCSSPNRVLHRQYVDHRFGRQHACLSGKLIVKHNVLSDCA